MIISRTPFRVSFFGGGTDYPEWYRQNGGAVLATAINKYCYISCRYLPPFFEHRYRIVYSKSEEVLTIDEIQHASVREVLRYLEIDRGVEIHHDGDLPARTGLGSSSAFTVGLLHAGLALKGQMPNKRQLASLGIHVERELLRETVGSQDQVLVAYGGFNHIVFAQNGEITVRPMTLPAERVNQLNAHLMLMFTGIRRTASDIAQTYVVGARDRQLRRMSEMVDDGVALLSGDGDITEFGRLLDEAWQLKRSLSAQISNPQIEEIYGEARAAGAIGGKLIGAGGGGFLLLFADPGDQPRIRERLGRLIHVPFRFDYVGSQIIFYDPEEDYSLQDRDRVNRGIDGFRERAEALDQAQGQPEGGVLR